MWCYKYLRKIKKGLTPPFPSPRFLFLSFFCSTISSLHPPLSDLPLFFSLFDFLRFWDLGLFNFRNYSHRLSFLRSRVPICHSIRFSIVGCVRILDRFPFLLLFFFFTLKSFLGVVLFEVVFLRKKVKKNPFFPDICALRSWGALKGWEHRRSNSVSQSPYQWLAHRLLICKGLVS